MKVKPEILEVESSDTQYIEITLFGTKKTLNSAKAGDVLLVPIKEN
jgi:hypothetical protein